MLDLAMAALDQEAAEFHGDPARTYLTGLSMGGYGAWELARLHPHRWAAIAIAASGIFWSYEPERWQQAGLLPAEYARAVGHTPVWLFHGSLDATVAAAPERAHVRRPQGRRRQRPLLALPGPAARLLDPRLRRAGPAAAGCSRTARPRAPETIAEFLMVPLHPPAIKLTTAQLDSLTGQYREPNGHAIETIFRQGDHLFEKSPAARSSASRPSPPTRFSAPATPPARAPSISPSSAMRRAA